MGTYSTYAHFLSEKGDAFERFFGDFSVFQLFLIFP